MIESLVMLIAAVALVYAIAQAIVIGMRYPPFVSFFEWSYGAAMFATIVGSIGILLKWDGIPFPWVDFFAFFSPLWHLLFFGGLIGMLVGHIISGSRKDEDEQR